MRWNVELPDPAGGPGVTKTVDAESWKAALSNARSGKALPKYRCDFEADGLVRVHDLVTNERFVLRPEAPPKEVQGERPRLSARPPPSDPATAESKPPSAATPPSAVSTAHDQAPNPGAPASIVAVGDEPELPLPLQLPPVVAPGEIFFERNVEPSPQAPLRYRERLIRVPPETSHAEAERVARAAHDFLRRQLRDQDRGRFISIAVFDHLFRSKPERAPLLVLEWRDWRGDAPELSFGVRGPSELPASAAPTTAIAIEVSQPSTDALPPAPEQATHAEPPEPQAPRAVPEPTASAEPEASPALTSPTRPPTEASTVAEAREPEAESPALSNPVAGNEPPAVEVFATFRPEGEVTLPAGAEVSTPEPKAPRAPALELSPEAAQPTQSTEAEPAPVPVVDTPSIIIAAELLEAAAAPVSAAPEKPAASPSPSPTPGAPEVQVTRPEKLSPDELLAAAFEATHEFDHHENPEDLAAVLHHSLTEIFHGQLTAVLLYDIDRDELRVSGIAPFEDRKGLRQKLPLGPRGEACLRSVAVLMSSAPTDDPLLGNAVDGPTLLVPAHHDRRLFGLLELRREVGGEDFSLPEKNAATFLAEKFAKSLSLLSKRKGFEEHSAQARSRR